MSQKQMSQKRDYRSENQRSTAKWLEDTAWARSAERLEEISSAQKRLKALHQIRLFGLSRHWSNRYNTYSGDSWKMRQRLPPRRDVEITTLHLRRTDGSEVQFEAAVGFDPQSGEPREVFLNGAKAGSDMAFVLADTAVAISVALQSGVKARAMVQSIARVPTELEGPPTAPASVIGAVLELLASYEKETEDDL